MVPWLVTATDGIAQVLPLVTMFWGPTLTPPLPLSNTRRIARLLLLLASRYPET